MWPEGRPTPINLEVFRLKFESDRDALLVACVTAARAVAGRSQRPVLGSIHLAAGEQGLSVTGTDLETTVCTKAVASIHESGAAALPGRQLIELLRRCGSGPVQVSSGEGHGAKVTWQRSKFELRGFDPGEFPQLAWPSAFKAAGPTQLATYEDGSEFRYHRMPLQMAEEAVAQSA